MAIEFVYKDMKSFIGEPTGAEPSDNRQFTQQSPGAGESSRHAEKRRGFILIPNCKLKFGLARNAPGI